jgi:hypothetical protein
MSGSRKRVTCWFASEGRMRAESSENRVFAKDLRVCHFCPGTSNRSRNVIPGTVSLLFDCFRFTVDPIMVAVAN